MSIHTKSLPQFERLEDQAILDDDLYLLNQTYFYKLRELAITDPEAASVRFGCSKEFIKVIVETDLHSFQSIASSVLLQFRPLFDESLLIEQMQKPTEAKDLALCIRMLQSSTDQL